MLRCFRLFFFCVCFSFCVWPPLAVQAQTNAVALQNAGFEEPYAAVNSSSDAPNQKAKITGQIAGGWSDNSNWADVSVEYSKETVNAHRGAAQKIDVQRVSSGAVQFVQNVPFKKGRVHRWRVWLRGMAGTGVSLILRKAGAPYTTYAEQPVNLSPEWKEVRVFGVMPEDTDGFLMIRALQPMTFWVDDSSLEDLTEARNDAPARKGNLLSGGGSFEAGMPFGWSVRFEGPMDNRFADPRPKIDRADAKAGTSALRCDILPGDNAQIRGPLFNFNFNRVHTVSVWLKAAQPNTSVEIQLQNSGLLRWVSVGTQWQRFSLSGNLPLLPFSQLRIFCPESASPRGNTLWIDGAMVEEKPEASSEYSQEFPVDLNLDFSRPGHLVFEDEKANIAINTAGTLPREAKLQLECEDLDGKIWTRPSFTLPAKSFALPNFNGRRGMWKMRAQVLDAQNKPISAPYELIWARIAKPKTINAKNSFFGTHISLAPYYIQLAKDLGTRRVRLHDTSMIGKWPFAEVEPGRWKFYDEGVTAAHNAGLRILGMLDGAPKWTSTQTYEGYWSTWNIPDKPEAKTQWETYVRTVTRHYKGRIDEWEVWNEPWGKWWATSGNPNATPELYADLMKRAYKITKTENPVATLVGVDTMNGFDSWTNGVLASANGEHFDVFSFHDYNDALYGGADNFAFQQDQRFRDFQKQYGPVRPLWNTEGGTLGVGSWYAPDAGGMSIQTQAAYSVRYNVSYMAAGVKNFFLYAIHTDNAMGEIETRTLEHDRAVKPILAARAVLASLVDGLGTPKRSEPQKGVDKFTYPRDAKKQQISVLWSYNGAQHKIAVPRGARVLDIWGNDIQARGTVSVGPQPIYFVQ